MFTGLLFTTGDMKKKKVRVPQRNEMLSLYCTALSFNMKNINPNKTPNRRYLKNMMLQSC